MSDILITEYLCAPKIHDAYVGTVEIINSECVDMTPNLEPFMLREISRNMSKLEMIMLTIKIYKLLLRRCILGR